MSIIALLTISICSDGKIGSFGFAFVLACVRGAKPNVPMWGAKEFNFFCAVAKKLKHEALGCRVGKKSARWSIFIPVVLKFVSQFMIFLFFPTLAANG